MNQLTPNPGRLELVVFVGLPAAGKSTFYRTQLAETHAVVHGAADRAKQISAALAAGRSMVVDGTHPTAAARREYIDLAQAHGARIVGYYFASTLRRSLAHNRLRDDAQRVPEQTIVSTFNQLERPTLEEGFHELWLVKALFDEQFLVSAWEQAHGEWSATGALCLAC